MRAAEAAIANPLLDETSMGGARGLLVSISGSKDLTLYELDEAVSRIREEVNEGTNTIVGATFDGALGDAIRVSLVATGIDPATEIRHTVGQSRSETVADPISNWSSTRSERVRRSRSATLSRCLQRASFHFLI